jgi:peroxiredoxin
LPVAEIVIAILLVFVESAWVASFAALALLFFFITAISLNLARGQKPDCNCFGQVHSQPISWSLVVRNLIFAGLALLIIAHGNTNVGSDILMLSNATTLAEKIDRFISLATIGLLCAIVFFLRRLLGQQQTILRRLEAMGDSSDGILEIMTRTPPEMPAQAIPIGTPSPQFSLLSIDGEACTLEHLLEKGKPLVLLFVSPSCAPCTALLPDLEYWQNKFPDRLTLALISKGSTIENQQKFDDYAIEYILLQKASEIADAYQIPWTPGAILINPDGTIASEVAYGSDQIKELMAHVAQGKAGSPWLAQSSDPQEEKAEANTSR